MVSAPNTGSAFISSTKPPLCRVYAVCKSLSHPLIGGPSGTSKPSTHLYVPNQVGFEPPGGWRGEQALQSGGATVH